MNSHQDIENKLNIYLVGSPQDKLAFLKKCGGSFYIHPIRDSSWGLSGSLNHKDVTFVITHYLNLNDDVDHMNYSTWLDVEPHNCRQNRLEAAYIKKEGGHRGLENADAIIYLNATPEQKKYFHQTISFTQTVQIDYVSDDFADALNCLENIHAPDCNEINDYNKKLSLTLKANEKDADSCFALLPKEVVHQICQVYSEINKGILFFKPQQNEVPTALLTVLRREEVKNDKIRAFNQTPNFFHINVKVIEARRVTEEPSGKCSIQ